MRSSNSTVDCARGFALMSGDPDWEADLRRYEERVSEASDLLSRALEPDQVGKLLPRNFEGGCAIDRFFDTESLALKNILHQDRGIRVIVRDEDEWRLMFCHGGNNILLSNSK